MDNNNKGNHKLTFILILDIKYMDVNLTYMSNTTIVLELLISISILIILLLMYI